MKYIVDIKGEIEGDYEIIGKYEERPQGEWIWLCDTPNSKYKWSCNKCGRGVKEQENYCPNCGIKMKDGME